MLRPRQSVPDLDLPLAGGGSFSFKDEKPGAFTMLVFYRGLHCPICKTDLGDLEAKIGVFKEPGVNAVAVTSDTQDRAEQTKKEWALQNLRCVSAPNRDPIPDWWQGIGLESKSA
jgi:peroxiredoxin